MLDLKFIRENPDILRDGLERRHMDTSVVDEIIRLDEERRSLILDVESKKQERNAASKEIGRMKDAAERQARIEATRLLGDVIAEEDAWLKTVEASLNDLLMRVPNIPDQDVPIGMDDKDNVVQQTFGEKPVYDFEPKPHWDLGPELGILDFEAGVKLSGSRFYVRQIC